MAWSTRQLAELAGTSLRAVRHYHAVGLLTEPERSSNGYKRYGVAHLVRLLRIKRLAELGFSLTQIADMGDADEHPEQELRALDAELARTIERLQAVRTELAVTLEQSAPTDLPTEMGLSADDVKFSAADRSFLVVLSRVLSPASLDVYAEMVKTSQEHPTEAELTNLPDDADEQTRHELAKRLAAHVSDLEKAFPRFLEAAQDTRLGTRAAAETIGVAITDLYNSAQIDVMRRLNTLLVAGRAAKAEPDTDDAEPDSDDGAGA
ncbi:DNA-binding transcriptional MerR regulator [Actinoalloteichus hoggarensis]|uniref:HTH-type transcriptional activator TipA n=1 Tax=Actinoalloteichus hoggarensis TaxID=1470176 RepID=A0A221W3J2_9PSEU|nr:MerR family transcriptional regulator [Actinoalloteichus hoggarensis]ASO20243.1 HTH-type transcriptional activator TipA [Actinoalloteichus hoggarensis]MBB5919043.1 DNA-binding transcriptional MerR regulator [Actinoalloteichus hoggarensis]